MHYKSIKEILGPVGNGITNPLIGTLDTNEVVIIKTLNNIEGNLVLINEYISHNIARKFNLPVPDSGIAVINNDTIVRNYDLRTENLGPCFYSKRVDKATLIKETIVNFISNKDDFLRLLIFDHIIYNKDRNIGNLLVTVGKGNSILYIIDHSHVFKNGAVWDSYCFIQGINTKDYRDNTIMEYNKGTYNMLLKGIDIKIEDLYSIAQNFKEIYKKINFDEIICKIPREWTILNKDVEMLIKYINYRVENLERICDVIFKEVNV